VLDLDKQVAGERQKTRELKSKMREHRQLKNQLEDAEFARTAAIKARQNCELELTDVQTQLEDISRAKSGLEERCVQLGRDKGSLATQLRENEEEMAELIKKYKASVAAEMEQRVEQEERGAAPDS